MDVSIAEKLAGLDWPALHDSLRNNGYALTPPLLTKSECDGLVGMYASETAFRSHIIMARYRFGRGDYKIFRLPSSSPSPGVAGERLSASGPGGQRVEPGLTIDQTTDRTSTAHSTAHSTARSTKRSTEEFPGATRTFSPPARRMARHGPRRSCCITKLEISISWIRIFTSRGLPAAVDLLSQPGGK